MCFNIIIISYGHTITINYKWQANDLVQLTTADYTVAVLNCMVDEYTTTFPSSSVFKYKLYFIIIYWHWVNYSGALCHRHLCVLNTYSIWRRYMTRTLFSSFFFENAETSKLFPQECKEKMKEKFLANIQLREFIRKRRKKNCVRARRLTLCL